MLLYFITHLGRSQFPSLRYTQIHTRTRSMHIHTPHAHTSSPSYTNPPPSASPNTHTQIVFIGSDQGVKQDRLSLEHPSPYSPKNSRCPSKRAALGGFRAWK